LKTALAYAEQGLLVIPDHENLLKLREQLKTRMIEQQKKQEEIQRKADIAERQRIEQAETMRKRQQADQYLVRASRYQEDGKYMDSLQQIEKGLAIIPDHEGLLRLKKEVHAKRSAAQRLSATKAAKEKERSQKRQTPVKTTVPIPVPAEKDAELKKLQDIKNAVDALNRSLDR
jgi:hypothetical protein